MPQRATDRPGHRRWIDLCALVVVVSAIVVLVIFGQAGAAVLTATGGVIVSTLRIWNGPRDR
ncbi:hypothetical protein [Nocardia huaxiensis]|uniref:hypothetical protein n=1 Tax=Nocardia huaxiensis TaxID=2755382 RepID=UPI001E57BAC8|nr:hypothetical protein [Nocardia huaxiensis]UFS98787.1 hypothetical protein LPY97_13275 [Nocardia huaxiensis]